VMIGMKATYTNPDADPGKWTRRDEIRQRIGNCKRFLAFAWLSLWWDSTIFAAVFFNCARSEGDAMISRIVTWNGKDSGDLVDVEERD